MAVLHGIAYKNRQTDLLQVMYGRNGESPVVVLAASTPADCFHYAFIAAKIALEHSTPVVLLTTALSAMVHPVETTEICRSSEIKPHYVKSGMTGLSATARDPETKARYWNISGVPGLEHRNGGLEKNYVTVLFLRKP